MDTTAVWLSASIRYTAWIIAFIVAFAGCADLVLSRLTDFSISGRKEFSLPSGVLGDSNRNAATVDELQGATYSFHRILDSELRKDDWQGLTASAAELPAGPERDLAIIGVLRSLETRTDSDIQLISKNVFGEEKPDREDSDVTHELTTAFILIDLLNSGTHKAAFTSRFGVLVSKAHESDFDSQSIPAIPSVESCRRKAIDLAVAALKEERLNNGPVLGHFLTPLVGSGKFFAISLLAGFIGAFGEFLAMKLQQYRSGDSRQTGVTAASKEPDVKVDSGIRSNGDSAV